MISPSRAMASMLPVDPIVNDIQHETPRPRSPRLRTHASASLLRFPACHESAARILSTPLLSHPTHAPTPERAGARHRRSISGAARRTRQAGDFAGRLRKARPRKNASQNQGSCGPVNGVIRASRSPGLHRHRRCRVHYMMIWIQQAVFGFWHMFELDRHSPKGLPPLGR